MVGHTLTHTKIVRFGRRDTLTVDPLRMNSLDTSKYILRQIRLALQRRRPLQQYVRVIAALSSLPTFPPPFPPFALVAFGIFTFDVFALTQQAHIRVHFSATSENGNHTILISEVVQTRFASALAYKGASCCGAITVTGQDVHPKAHFIGRVRGGVDPR